MREKYSTSLRGGILGAFPPTQNGWRDSKKKKEKVGSIPVYFREVVPETDPVEAGPVAQGIRARGYEPRCRGFESLLAHKKPIIPEMSLISWVGVDV